MTSSLPRNVQTVEQFCAYWGATHNDGDRFDRWEVASWYVDNSYPVLPPKVRANLVNEYAVRVTDWLQQHKNTPGTRYILDRRGWARGTEWFIAEAEDSGDVLLDKTRFHMSRWDTDAVTRVAPLVQREFAGLPELAEMVLDSAKAGPAEFEQAVATAMELKRELLGGN